MSNSCTVIISLMLVFTIILVPTTFGQSTAKTLSDTDLKLLKSSDVSKKCKDLGSERMGLESPREALMWPDYRGEPSAGLWSNLSIVLAGFSFLAIIALLQSCVGRNAADGACVLNNRDLSTTLSVIAASLLLFMIAADLFSWADGDKIEMRNSITFMVANFVAAQGMLTILFGLIWAFHLFQVHPFANRAIRWVFVFMLVYLWTFLIPSCGDVLALIQNYEVNLPSDTEVSKFFWYTDKYFWGWCAPLAVFPLIAHFLNRSRHINGWFSSLNEKPVWAIVSGLFAVGLALWIITANYLIEYTGKPCDPVIIERVKWFAPPYKAQALLMIIFGLIEGLAVLSFPPTSGPMDQQGND